MALRNVVTIGDEALTKVCREVTNFDARLHILLDDMLETMRSQNGAGLAANQVGVLRRVVVIETEQDNPVELVNPVMTETDGEQEGGEGCLSVPGKYGIVKRPARVKVSAFDRHGKPFELTGEGLTARALCHELDHLDGKLYTDLVIRYIEKEEQDEE